MLDKIKSLGKDELMRGSLILFIMIGVFNLLNYVFQISMARMLGPADYSILAVLMSFIYIFGIPNEAVQTIVSKYTSRFNVSKNLGKMKELLNRSLKRGMLFAVILFILFVILAYPLSVFLDINFFLVALSGFFIFYVFSVPIVRGLIQGRKKFSSLGFNFIIEGFVKVLAAVIFVFIGFKVYGAILGMLAGGIMAFIVAFIPIKEILLSKWKNEKFKGIYFENIPILLAMTAIVLVYSLDVILARRFFSPETAGIYSFVSLIAKSIIFISFAVGKTMFPAVVESFERGENSRGILKKSLALVSLISIAACLLFFLFPEPVIYIVSLGSGQYLSAYYILGILGLAFSFISLANIIITYKLATHKIKYSSVSLLIFVVLEVILLTIFNSNLKEFSIALLFSSLIMFLYSLILLKK